MLITRQGNKAQVELVRAGLTIKTGRKRTKVGSVMQDMTQEERTIKELQIKQEISQLKLPVQISLFTCLEGHWWKSLIS